MTQSMFTGGTTSQGPVISATPSAIVSSDEFKYGITLPQNNNVPSVNGLFKGTLSAQGNMVAMALNTGGPNYISTGSVDENGSPISYAAPWLTGYAREYWKNPTMCTFGSNSAIPALTGVMPDGLPMTGCASYYVDLQLTRLSGSNYFDNFAFIGSFNKALSWVVSSNDYLLALKKAESNNLAYYGATSYQEFLTNGFSKYNEGQALKTAIGNVGKYIQQIVSGYFGTPNSVAKFLVDSGLGAYGGLTAQLIADNIPLDDNIYNELYTKQIEAILKTINNTNDLIIIQAVLASTIPDIKNPLAYTSIELASGLQNDSLFKTFVEFGVDLKNRSPNFNIRTGKELVAIIDQLLTNTSPSLENLATTTSILPQSVIDGLRSFLPYNKNNDPVTMLNIIGTPSGYLTDYLKAVNEGIDQIDKSAYGPQLRTALTAVDTAYTNYRNSISVSSGPDGETIIIIPPESITKLDKAKSDYLALVSTVANDPVMSSIVNKINTNYYTMCELLTIEVTNYNKGGMASNVTYRDNNAIYSFVSSLPSYASDSLSIGTGYLLYGMCQDNDAGNIIKALLNQYKNNTVLANAGVRTTNII